MSKEIELMFVSRGDEHEPNISLMGLMGLTHSQVHQRTIRRGCASNCCLGANGYLTPASHLPSKPTLFHTSQQNGTTHNQRVRRVGHQPPSRASFLHVVVKSDGPQHETVSKNVTTKSNDLNQLFKELSPKNENGFATVDAPVTTFSSTLLRTWSRLTTSDKNRPLDRVYFATSSFEIIFCDFNKLSEIAGKLVAHPNVEIDSIDWRLTDDTKKALGSESRKLALRDAIGKANDYVNVIGREVVAVEITDEETVSNIRAKQVYRGPPPAPPLRGGGLFSFGSAAPAVMKKDDTSLDLNP